MTASEIIENKVIADKINDLLDKLLIAGFDFRRLTIEIGLDGLKTIVNVNECCGVAHDT